eukprot:m.52747 g.52747  ORF g.52747 m.52747 type:complete len:393 (-) comp13099_c0_seq1:165-1343(-)
MGGGAAMDPTLLIRASAFDDLVLCPICMGQISDCLISGVCGHRFCAACITECLAHKKICPCCNGPLEKEQMVKDGTFNTIIETLQREKTDAENRYFQRLIDGATISERPTEPTATATTTSPIEALFRQHFRQSIAEFQKVFCDLEAKAQLARERETAAFATSSAASTASAAATVAAGGSALDPEVLLAQRLLEIDDQQRKYTSLLTRACGDYLQRAIPTGLAVLPVRVDIYLPARGYTARSVLLEPTDSGDDIKAKLLKDMAANSFKPVRCSEGAFFRLVRPLMTDPADVLITDKTIVRLETTVEPGSSLVLVGDVVLQEDLPKRCLRTTFDPATAEPVTYHTCKTCQLNWLCDACKTACHVGHETSVFTKNHVPAFACCYCSRKGACTLCK